MNLVSFTYFIYIFISSNIYNVFPLKFKYLVILISNFIFIYSLGTYAMCWCLLCSLITYISSILISKTKNIKLKKDLMIFSIILLLMILSVFKYGNSFILELAIKAKTTLVQPIGMSFYLFSMIGYIIDIKNNKYEVIKKPLRFLACVLFFPKFLQGPIESIQRINEQLNENKELDEIQFNYSFFTILLGIFFKTVFANRFVIIIDTIYNKLTINSGITAMTAISAIILYSFYIYTDFLGYSYIAKGSAMLYGIDLAENFKHPYLAKSISDFWQRWHISLTTWFRQYVYYPLGGSRISKKKTFVNIIVVFIVSGIWHGNSFLFLIWGLAHGLLSAYEHTKKRKTKKNVILQILFNYGIVTILWTVFRGPNISTVISLYKSIISFPADTKWTIMSYTKNELYFSILSLILIFVYDYFDEKISIVDSTTHSPILIKWLIYLVLIFTIILYGYYGTLSQESFIYEGF